jgi:autotransporter translocation and assembly factor TamB
LVLSKIPPVQRFAISVVNKKTSELLKCNVTVGTIAVDFRKGLVVKKIVLTDPRHERATLRADRAETSIDLPSVFKFRFKLRSISVEGLSGELLNVRRGFLAGPLDIGRIVSLFPPALPHSQSFVNAIGGERCTVSYVDSFAKISTREIVNSFRLSFIYADSLTFVLNGGTGIFASPVWSGSVVSNNVKGIIGPTSLEFGSAEVHGDSATVSLQGSIPFALKGEWDLTAATEAYVAGFPIVYKSIRGLNPVGKLSARGSMTGTSERPILDLTVTGHGLRLGQAPADSLLLRAHYAEELFAGNGWVRSAKGLATASVRVNVYRLFSSPSVGKYAIASSVKNVDIGSIFAKSHQPRHAAIFLTTATIFGAGSGLRRLPDTMAADVQVRASALPKTPIVFTARLARNTWDIAANMETDFEIKGNGQYSDSGSINGSLHVRIDSIAPIVSIFSREALRGSIAVDADLNGSLQRPIVSALIYTTHLNWRDIAISKLWTRISVKNNSLFIDTLSTIANGPIASAMQGFVSVKVAGNAWVQAHARGRLDSLDVDAEMHVGKCSYNQYHADSLSTQVHFVKNTVEWKSLYAKLNTSDVASNGSVSWEKRVVSLTTDCNLTRDKRPAGLFTANARFAPDSAAATLNGTGLDPAFAAPWFPPAKRLLGSLDVKGTLAGASKNPNIQLAFTYDHPVSSNHVVSASGNVSFSSGIANATIQAIQKGTESPLVVTAHVPVVLSELSKGISAIRNGATVAVRGDSIEYGDLLSAFVPSVQSRGTISLKGKVAKDNNEWALSCTTHVVNKEVTARRQEIKAGYATFDCAIAGPMAHPFGQFAINGDSIQFRGALITRYSGKGSIKGNKLILDTLSVACAGGGVELSAAVPISFEKGISFGKSAKVSATLVAMPLAFAQPFMPEPVAITNGVLSGRVSLEGVDKGLPQSSGTLVLTNGEVVVDQCDKPLAQISANVDFSGDSIVLRKLTSVWGGGHISGNGWAVLNEKGISSAHSAVTLNNVRVGGCYENLNLGIQNATISITKDSITTIAVDASLADTRFTQDFSIVELGKQVKKKAPQTTRPPNPAFNKVAMSVAVKLNNNLTFESNLGKMLLDGTVTLAGRPDKPAIGGTVQIANGYVYYLDRRFTVSQGTISQRDPAVLNPSLDITATSTMSWYPPQGGREDYDITLLLRGDLSTPVITLSATPSLAQPQIISLLTFGTIQTGVGNDFGSRTGSLVGEQLAGLGTRKLARLLNVESVDINGNIFDPSSQRQPAADIYGNASGPSTEGPQLSVTKQISSRVAVTYSKGLSMLSQQMVLVSYRLLSFLYLEAETDQQAQGGIDLKFRYSR